MIGTSDLFSYSSLGMGKSLKFGHWHLRGNLLVAAREFCLPPVLNAARGDVQPSYGRERSQENHREATSEPRHH